MPEQYPKLLAFIHLFYPDFYDEICYYSEKSDIVEAKLICSNESHGFSAIVYSQGEMQEGKLFSVRPEKSTAVKNSWNWCWVFAVNILFKEEVIFPLRFKQKVIALPDGNDPLTALFFKVIEDEFIGTLQKITNQSIDEQRALQDCYSDYVTTEKN